MATCTDVIGPSQSAYIDTDISTRSDSDTSRLLATVGKNTILLKLVVAGDMSSLKQKITWKQKMGTQFAE